MIGFQAVRLTPKEMEHYRVATVLVEALPESADIRCHELARAIGGLLELPVVDGHFHEGWVEHSWLILRHDRGRTTLVLDVYSVARLPMVQVVDMDWHGEKLKPSYVEGPEREDIDEKSWRRINEVLRNFLHRRMGVIQP